MIHLILFFDFDFFSYHCAIKDSQNGFKIKSFMYSKHFFEFCFTGYMILSKLLFIVLIDIFDTFNTFSQTHFLHSLISVDKAVLGINMTS